LVLFQFAITFYKILDFPLEATLSRFLSHTFSLKTLVINENQKLRAKLVKQRSSNTKVQFVLRKTKAGDSTTESLINHLKSKHRIHVIVESDDHKTIPAQEEIRSQIM